jgi:hypothetical protein
MINFSKELQTEDTISLDQHEIQLAAISTAATGWIDKPLASDSWAWSVAFEDVMVLRHKYEVLLKRKPWYISETSWLGLNRDYSKK